MKARHKASLLTTTRKLENIFPSLQFPPLLLHFHLPDGGCALIFAGIIFLSIPIFLAWNACGQIKKKPWVLKTSEFFFFKNPEFWKISEFKKNLSFENIWLFFKKNLSFEQIWVKKKREI